MYFAKLEVDQCGAMNITFVLTHDDKCNCHRVPSSRFKMKHTCYTCTSDTFRPVYITHSVHGTFMVCHFIACVTFMECVVTHSCCMTLVTSIVCVLSHTSRHVTSRHVTSRHVTSRHVTSRHVTSRHVT